MSVTREIFGILKEPNLDKAEATVTKYTLQNKHGMEISVISYGAAITSLKIPDVNGDLRDIVLGFDTLEEYTREYPGGYGSVVGRVANFIEYGKFSLHGKTYELRQNKRGHHLHGGANGFHTKNWELTSSEGSKLVFACISEDGEEGYPGEVKVQVSFELKDTNELAIAFEATPTNKPTPINISSHGHFNLGGHETANQRLKHHFLQIFANEYTVPGVNGIPNGKIETVENTNLDFRKLTSLSEILEQFPPGPNGFNTNYCINPIHGSENHVAKITHNNTKIVMDIYSNQPGVQFYTGQHWPDPANNDEPITGKSGAHYMKYGFIALETQNYPNAVNVESFPNTIVNPGDTYLHTLTYKFSIAK